MSYAPQPSYQASAVAVYIKNSQGLPPAKFFNPSNRGFPDVAAWATEYSIVVEWQTAGVSGTSASTPTWAGVFSLLSDLRLNAGKAPLGFANPFLYACGVLGLRAAHRTLGVGPGVNGATLG